MRKYIDDISSSLGDKNRRKIIRLLLISELSVSQLLKNFDISQATLSSHLSYLKDSGLVESRKFGRQRVYSLKKHRLRRYIDYWLDLIEISSKKTIENEPIVDKIISRRAN